MTNLTEELFHHPLIQKEAEKWRVWMQTKGRTNLQKQTSPEGSIQMTFGALMANVAMSGAMWGICADLLKRGGIPQPELEDIKTRLTQEFIMSLEKIERYTDGLRKDDVVKKNLKRILKKKILDLKTLVKKKKMKASDRKTFKRELRELQKLNRGQKEC